MHSYAAPTIFLSAALAGNGGFGIRRQFLSFLSDLSRRAVYSAASVSSPS
jgi:hypothetical protein